MRREKAKTCLLAGQDLWFIDSKENESIFISFSDLFHVHHSRCAMCGEFQTFGPQAIDKKVKNKIILIDKVSKIIQYDTYFFNSLIEELSCLPCYFT